MAIKSSLKQCCKVKLLDAYSLEATCLQVHGGTLVILHDAANHPDDGASHVILCPLPSIS
jgi:hypothetical protein